MTRDKIKDTKKELGREDDDFYGEETVSGSSPRPSSDDNVNSMLSKAVGPNAKDKIRKHKAFSIGSKVKEEE